MNAHATFDPTVSYRTSIAQLFSSPGDTPVTASQARHLTTVTTANRINWLHGRHNFRAGLDFQHFPVRENFTFGVTDSNFNRPGADKFIRTLADYDLSRGESCFDSQTAVRAECTAVSRRTYCTGSASLSRLGCESDKCDCKRPGKPSASRAGERRIRPI